MQYILTKEEYENLVPIDEKSQRDHALNTARELIIKISKFPCGETYCDGCPISQLADLTDSKEVYDINRKFSKLICGKYRQYSK